MAVRALSCTFSLLWASSINKQEQGAHNRNREQGDVIFTGSSRSIIIFVCCQPPLPQYQRSILAPRWVSPSPYSLLPPLHLLPSSPTTGRAIQPATWLHQSDPVASCAYLTLAIQPRVTLAFTITLSPNYHYVTLPLLVHLRYVEKVKKSRY